MTVKAFLATVGVICGFIGGWLITFTIAFEVGDTSCEDLPCGDEWGGIISAGAFFGALVGGVAGWLIGRWSERRS